MVKNVYTILIVLVVVANAFLVLKKASRINSTPNSAIDVVDLPLSTIKKSVKPNTKLGFYTNDATNKMQLHFHTQFLMAPGLVIDHATDTMILVINKKQPYHTLSNYKLLAAQQDSVYQYLLVKAAR